jgi:hypothetical protein
MTGAIVHVGGRTNDQLPAEVWRRRLIGEVLP